MSPRCTVRDTAESDSIVGRAHRYRKDTACLDSAVYCTAESDSSEKKCNSRVCSLQRDESEKIMQLLAAFNGSQSLKNVKMSIVE